METIGTRIANVLGAGRFAVMKTRENLLLSDNTSAVVYTMAYMDTNARGLPCVTYFDITCGESAALIDRYGLVPQLENECGTIWDTADMGFRNMCGGLDDIKERAFRNDKYGHPTKHIILGAYCI